MKKIFTLIIILLLSSCNNNDFKIIEKKISTWVVLTWSIDIDQNYIGYIEWKEMIDLSSEISWKLIDIYFEEWDFVKKWELIWKIDSWEAQIWYINSKNIINKLYSTKKSIIESYDEQIIIYELQLLKNNILNNWLKVWLKNNINIKNTELELAKIWINLSRSNFEQSLNILEINKSNIISNSKNSIVWAIILDTNIINFIDNILWITEKNKDKNDNFENYLSAKNSLYLKQAIEKFTNTNNKYLIYKKFYDNNIEWIEPDIDNILIGLDDWIILAEELNSVLNLVYKVLDNTIENVNFTKITIDNYKNTLLEFWNDIESSLINISWDYILWLKWSNQSIIDINELIKKETTLLKNKISYSEEKYNQLKIINDWIISDKWFENDVSIKNIDEVKINIELLKKQKKTKILEIESLIIKTNWERDSSLEIINNGNIISPIDGIILSKYFEIWQIILNWNPVVKIWNNSELVVKVWINNDLYKNISIWDKILLHIDWSNSDVFWYISKIYPFKDLYNKKHIVEISINNIDKKINIWSYVDVFFQNKTELKNLDTNLISNKSIVSKYMLPGVYVLKKWYAVFTYIDIIKQNELFSEIKWLNTGDIIIINWKENIWDWELLKK